MTVEKLGIPALGVMTAHFISAAELMSRVLGMPGYPFAVIDHPISSAGQTALEAMAVATIEQGRALLVRQ